MDSYIRHQVINILHACILMKINASPTAIATTKARICTSWHTKYSDQVHATLALGNLMKALKNYNAQGVRGDMIVRANTFYGMSFEFGQLLQLKGFVTFFDINVYTFSGRWHRERIIGLH
uniref:Uncharacterized protein n=1 Tax=Glossina austeni TaxID=7395 RepID=A0A1A9V4X7_GLOAU